MEIPEHLSRLRVRYPPVDNNPNAVPVSLPEQKHTGLFISAYRRRPLLLLSLMVGLAIFLVWLPSQARAALWTGLIAQRSLVSMLFFFVLIALSLVWSVGQRVDSYIFIFLNQRYYYSQRLDSIMWLTTQLGSMWAAFISAFVFFFLAYRRLAIEIILATITLWLMVETIKMLTDRARPFLVLEATRIVGRKESGRSFPSGHTSQIFFMATLLSRELKLDLGQTVVLYLIALLVGLTRIYVGAHYPRDVLGGAVLGSAWGVIAVLIHPYLDVIRI